MRKSCNRAEIFSTQVKLTRPWASAFLLLFLLNPRVAPASNWKWMDSACRRDSCLHFATAYAGTLTGAELLLKKAKLSPSASLGIAAGGVLLLGIAKEVMADPVWDGRDISANILGALGAAGVFYVLEF